MSEPNQTTTKLKVKSVSANGKDGSIHVPGNTIDGKLDTRWSLQGISGKYITYDLGKLTKVSNVKIAWYNGGDRKAYFKIRAGNSTSTLKTIVDKKKTGSSGKSEQLETYTFPEAITVRYVRISCFGNDDNDWNSITETEIHNSSKTPFEALGLLNWKLNGLKGTKSKNEYEDKTPNLPSHTNSDWFFLKDEWVSFQVWAGSATSSGSGNPRMELRELTADGTDNIYWDGTTDTEHRMLWKVRVDRLPSSGKVCFGQIHDKTKKFDDVIRIQCQGKPNQSKGSLKMRINGFVTEKLEGGGKTKGRFDIGEELHLELTYKKGIVKLYRLDEEANRIETIYKSKKVPAHQNYFKVGNYLQSMKNKKFGSWDYGSVSVKEIQVFH